MTGIVREARTTASGAQYRVADYGGLFTVQMMAHPDHPGYGVWEDVCTRPTLAEADEVVTAHVGGVTFRVDGRVVAASDVRASVNLGDGRSMEVVLTHEGTIVDFFIGPGPDVLVLGHAQLHAEHLGTTASTYAEAFDAVIGPVGEAWAIRSLEPIHGEVGLWWSNDDGWVDANSRTEFPDTSGNLPIGACEWVRLV